MEIFENSKFLENVITIRWSLPLNAEDVTAWNLLSSLRGVRSRKYDTLQKWTYACTQAGGFRSRWGISSFGSQLLVTFQAAWLKEKWMNLDHYSQKIVDLLEQTLNEPLLNEDVLEESRFLMREALMYRQSNPGAAAMETALKTCQKDHPVSVNMHGSLEALKTVTLKDLQSLNGLLEKQPCSIYGMGEFDPAVLKFLNGFVQQPPEPLSCFPLQTQEAVRTVIEKPIVQSSMVQTYQSGIVSTDDAYPVLQVLNGLLGACQSSILFDVVREQHGCCYYIGSFVVESCGLLGISVQADAGRLDEIRRLIRQVLEDVSRGEFDPHLLVLVKNELHDQIDSIEDSPRHLINRQFKDKVLQRSLTLEQRHQRIDNVTIEDVKKAASRLHLLSECAVVQEDKKDE